MTAPALASAVVLFLELVTASDARWDRSERTLHAVAEHCRAVDGLAPRHRAGRRARSRAGSSVERARTAVTFRIRVAIKRIAEQHTSPSPPT